MKNISLLFPSLLVGFPLMSGAAAPVSTNVKPDYCQVRPVADIKKVSVTNKPSYFFRVFPKSEIVSFASSSRNYLIDLNTSQIKSIPGQYDPVPLGEHIMSVPNHDTGMRYYAVSEIMNEVKEPKTLFVSGDMGGVYQSTALMERTDTSEIYGIIAAGIKETQFQKIKVTYKPTLKVEPVGGVEKICTEWDIKLPMLSKNGQEISGFDGVAGVSKIWRIDHKTNRCFEVDNLGVFAAKADFSYDSKKLVFHLNANGSTYKLKSNGTGDIDWLENPTQEMSQSVYQYDREKRTLTRISYNEPGSNAYYPVYQADGSIVYAVVEANGESRFELIHPHQVAQATSIRVVDQSSRFEVLTAIAIGKLWNMVCSPQIPIKSPETLLITGLGLSKKACHDLIRDHWNVKNQIAIIQNKDIVPLPGSRIDYKRELMSLIEPRDLDRICDRQ